MNGNGGRNDAAATLAIPTRRPTTYAEAVELADLLSAVTDGPDHARWPEHLRRASSHLRG